MLIRYVPSAVSVSWNYRIVAPIEAGPLMENPAEYMPRTSLGTFRAIFEWITSRADKWHARGADGVSLPFGEEGSLLIELTTVRRGEELAEVFRRRERSRDKSYQCIDEWRASYAPRDDEAVTEVS